MDNFLLLFIGISIFAIGDGGIIPSTENDMRRFINLIGFEDFKDSKPDKDEIATKKVDIKFLFHPDVIDESVIELTPQNHLQLIDLTKPTKIIIHGWLSNGTASWIIKMAQAYHKIGDYNVISVDWSKNAAGSYLRSANMVSSVGTSVGQFIKILANGDVALLNNIHIIGHSFGAHVAAVAGYSIQQNMDSKIDRITGLDPAGPLFEYPGSRDDAEKLSQGDAVFVDVIHTSAGLLGMTEKAGSLDYFVNKGGPLQPGCGQDFMEQLDCSHSLAIEYFLNSIETSDPFKGVWCWNQVLYDYKIFCGTEPGVTLGENAERNLTGSVFLET